MAVCRKRRFARGFHHFQPSASPLEGQKMKDARGKMVIFQRVGSQEKDEKRHSARGAPHSSPFAHSWLLGRPKIRGRFEQNHRFREQGPNQKRPRVAFCPRLPSFLAIDWPFRRPKMEDSRGKMAVFESGILPRASSTFSPRLAPWKAKNGGRSGRNGLFRQRRPQEGEKSDFARSFHHF